MRRNKEMLIALLKREFPDWDDGGHEECLEDAEKLIGEEAILRFLDSGDIQGRAMVLNVFQAINSR